MRLACGASFVFAILGELSIQVCRFYMSKLRFAHESDFEMYKFIDLATLIALSTNQPVGLRNEKGLSRTQQTQ